MKLLLYNADAVNGNCTPEVQTNAVFVPVEFTMYGFV
jgi:hypothetical protein